MVSFLSCADVLGGHVWAVVVSSSAMARTDGRARGCRHVWAVCAAVVVVVPSVAVVSSSVFLSWWWSVLPIRGRWCRVSFLGGGGGGQLVRVARAYHPRHGVPCVMPAPPVRKATTATTAQEGHHDHHHHDRKTDEDTTATDGTTTTAAHDRPDVPTPSRPSFRPCHR